VALIRPPAPSARWAGARNCLSARGTPDRHTRARRFGKKKPRVNRLHSWDRDRIATAYQRFCDHRCGTDLRAAWRDWTFKVRPWNSVEFNAAMAFSASCWVPISTNPNPRELSEPLSLTTLADSTVHGRRKGCAAVRRDRIRQAAYIGFLFMFSSCNSSV